MNEAEVARHALEVAEEVRLHLHGTHVNAIRLAVGPLASVDDQTLRAAFAALSRGGPAEGADLWIDREPFAGSCTGCGAPLQAERPFDRCPACGVATISWDDAGETEVVSVEIGVQAVG